MLKHVLIVTVVVCLSLLWGCGEESAPTQAPSTPPAPSTSIADVAEEAIATAEEAAAAAKEAAEKAAAEAAANQEGN